MTLVAHARRDPTLRLVALALAAGVPLACYIATASAHGYWLDGGEFVAAGVDLGIAHPPGHPLQSLVARAVAFIPLGPLAFRIALASALCTAGAALFLFRAIDTTVRAAGVGHDWVSTPLALGATWLVAGSYGWWFQAVRPEVYGLQALLACFFVERVIALEALWPTRDVRPLFAGFFALGLALANHHFIAFLLLPAMAPTLARVQRAHGLRPIVIAGLCVALGLATYVYLPVRARLDPDVNLGAPTSLDRIVWVVTAKVFQKHAGLVDQSLGERFADLAVLLVENLHAVPTLLAFAGSYALLRAQGARRIGTIWVLTAFVGLVARAWLQPVRANPDVLGYLMEPFGGLAALAVSFIAIALASLDVARKTYVRKTAILLAIVVALLGLTQLHAGAARAALTSFSAPDAFADGRRRALPARAIVLAHSPQTVFQALGGEAEDHARPDVLVVPMPFLDYPGMTESLLRREPGLQRLLRGYLLEGELRQPDLQSLAAERPLFLEMDVRVPQALYETIVPGDLLYEVLADGATDTDERTATRARVKALAQLEASLGNERDEPETRNQLLTLYYLDVLYHAGFGDRDAARESLQRALAVQPLALELQALGRALADPEEKGPLDVTPFLAGRATPPPPAN